MKSQIPHEFRFWMRVDIRGENECWEWQGTRNRLGYGYTFEDKVRMRAHRVAYEYAKGPIPDGLHILHACDNPSCVNPNHLRAGTPYENSQDRVQRGRGSMLRMKGTQHGMAILSEAHVADIRTRHASGKYTYGVLAEMYGVSKSAIGMIVRRDNWRHI